MCDPYKRKNCCLQEPVKQYPVKLFKVLKTNQTRETKLTPLKLLAKSMHDVNAFEGG